MENIDNALKELNLIIDDACDGKLTETVCKKRLDEFRAKYGNKLIHGKPLGNIKKEPASEDKLQKLRIIRAQGGTSEETLLEMARTGRKLRQRKISRMIATITAVVAVVAIVVAVVSALKK